MSSVVPLHKPRVELDADGMPCRAFIPSQSEPGKVYEA